MLNCRKQSRYCFGSKFLNVTKFDHDVVITGDLPDPVEKVNGTVWILHQGKNGRGRDVNTWAYILSSDSSRARLTRLVAVALSFLSSRDLLSLVFTFDL